MASSTVRIGPQAHAALRALAAETGESMQVVLERAIEDYRRRRFLEAANASYAALRSNLQAWQDELEERALWQATSADGLDEDDV